MFETSCTYWQRSFDFRRGRGLWNTMLRPVIHVWWTQSNTFVHHMGSRHLLHFQFIHHCKCVCACVYCSTKNYLQIIYANYVIYIFHVLTFQITFLIDWRSANKFPALVIFYINGCFMVSCIGWLVQFTSISRDVIICRKDGTLRTREPRHASF